MVCLFQAIIYLIFADKATYRDWKSIREYLYNSTGITKVIQDYKKDRIDLKPISADKIQKLNNIIEKGALDPTELETSK
jgi:hypothetical protein